MSGEFIIEDGVLVKYTGDDIKIVLPSGVAEIGERVFAESKRITEVMMPDSVTKIGSCAFEKCVRLQKIQFSNNLEEIGFAAFRGCKALKEIDLPDTLNFLHSCCFDGCIALKKINYPKAFIDIYRPDISIKNPSEQVKVEILEEVVQKGTLQNLIDVLSAYKTFEVTARALGLAARYRGVEFVETLIEYGASFKYDSSIAEEYGMKQWGYSTEYYLMIIPKKLDLHINRMGWTAYSHSAMCGIPFINIALDMVPLSIDERIRVVKYLAKNKKEEISLDEMLFEALTTGELDFADALIEMGVDLNQTHPSYYTTRRTEPTYIDMITSAPRSMYWNSYVERMSNLKPQSVLPVLERFGKLAVMAGEKLVINQNMFDQIKWRDDSLSYLIYADVTRISQKKIMELAVSTNSIGALNAMAGAGWLKSTQKREELIDFARNNKYKDALAWLMDYKNKNVDVAKEIAKEEAKMIKELMGSKEHEENPNSVSALKKNWSYEKLADGTLQITGYKGDEEDVEIPVKIGRAYVTSIGWGAFSPDLNGVIKNKESRRRIKTVVIPEGVTEIGMNAFRGCVSLECIKIPKTMKKIESFAFEFCRKLKQINIPENTIIESLVFAHCKALENDAGYIIMGDTLYYGSDRIKVDNSILVVPKGIVKIECSALESFNEKIIKKIILPDGLVEIGDEAFENRLCEEVVIPNTVKKIGRHAFAGCSLKSIHLPEGLSYLGEAAFEKNEFKELRIPKSLTELPSKAFFSCGQLRDVFIPDTVTKIGELLFGEYGKVERRIGNLFIRKEEKRVKKNLCIHTPSGSVAEAYMKDYSGINVSNDYTE